MMRNTFKPPTGRIGKRLMKIFNGDDNKREIYADIADSLDASTEVDEPEEVEFDDEEIDESELPEKLEDAINAMIVANPTLTKQQAAHHLLHTAEGRALFNHINKKETTTMPDTLEKILKDFGGDLTRICKNIVEAGDTSGVTEKQLTKLATCEALKSQRAGESEAQAFSRYFQSDEALPLRKAIQIAKGMNYGTAKSHGF
jgi:hypothetical protein